MTWVNYPYDGVCDPSEPQPLPDRSLVTTEYVSTRVPPYPPEYDSLYEMGPVLTWLSNILHGGRKK